LESVIPGAHRRPIRRPWLLILAEIGVLISMSIGFFTIGLSWHAAEHKTLITRVTTACRDTRAQSYLTYEACREANQQAEALGLEVVPLPALDPTPMTPATATTATGPTPVSIPVPTPASRPRSTR
jgi:hypothetical protein